MTTTTPGDDTRTQPIDDATVTTGTRRWLRFAAVAGIVGAVLHLSMGAAVGFPPAVDDPADELRPWFADNEGVIDLVTWLMPVTASALAVSASTRRALPAADPLLPLIPVGSSTRWLLDSKALVALRGPIKAG